MNTAGGVDSDLVSSPSNGGIDADTVYNICVDTDDCRVIYSGGRGYIYIYVHYVRGYVGLYIYISGEGTLVHRQSAWLE